MSCLCNRRIKEKNAKLATMNYKSCTTVAAAAEACEQRRLRTPKYTMAASNSGTVTTQMDWNPGPSWCIRSWHCKVGERVKMKETFYGDNSSAKLVASNETGCEKVKRQDDEAGPSGINWTSVAASIQARGGLARRNDDEAGPSGMASGSDASVAAAVEVTGTGFVNGRPVMNRLFIEQLFEGSSDSDDDWWNPDEGFHEVFPEGNNLFFI